MTHFGAAVFGSSLQEVYVLCRPLNALACNRGLIVARHGRDTRNEINDVSTRGVEGTPARLRSIGRPAASSIMRPSALAALQSRRNARSIGEGPFPSTTPSRSRSARRRAAPMRSSGNKWVGPVYRLLYNNVTCTFG